MKNSVRLSLALSAGVAFALAPLVIEKLEQQFGNNAQVGMFGDLLWMPGQLLARMIYPEGVHTEFGSSAFIPLSLGANVIFFTGLAYLLIRLVTRTKDAI